MAVGTALGIGSLLLGGAGLASSLSAAGRQRKAAQGVYDLAASNPEAFFGTRPEPVDYTPLFEADPGYAKIALDTIRGSIRNEPKAAELTDAINTSISQQTRKRIEGWDPTFTASMTQLQKNRDMVNAGYLPYADALSIAADRGRLANDLGQSGGASPQIAADLGMKKLDLMTNVGPQLSQMIANIIGQVDPVGRHALPQDYLLAPSQTVPWAIQENQFGATFQAEQNAIAAMPDPAAAGLLNLQAWQAGMGSGGGTASALSGLSQLFASASSMFGRGAPAAAASASSTFRQMPNPTPPIAANFNIKGTSAPGV